MTDGTAELVTVEEIRAAAARIDGVVARTPVVAVEPAGRILLKAESLQPVGSFKFRGAYATVASLSPAARARGVITYSSGNHGLALTRSGRLLGAPVTVVLPTSTPRAKRDRMLAEGAELVELAVGSEERRAHAERLATDRGLELVPPYDDRRVIAGQGTIGIELLEQVPDLAAVLIPVSGGGLASGIAAAIRRLRPSVRLIGVEPELAADARASLAAGEIVTWTADQTARTMADGARSQALGRLTFPHLRALLDEIVTVSEDEIAAAVQRIARDARLIAEPTGALAPAAVFSNAGGLGLDRLAGPTVAILSGGNVDPERLLPLLAREPSAAST